MGFRCGIIGLPNVGKSTLFNALTRTSAAQAENYPFCTIEPNIGEVDVPDKRLEVLSKLNKSLNNLDSHSFGKKSVLLLGELVIPIWLPSLLNVL